jgi:hypothetical protein
MSKSDDSIIIGGVGGSGTRVFAESLRHAGIRSLSDLNKASDHLGSTLLFKRRNIFDDIQDGHFESIWALLEKALQGGQKPTLDEKILLKSLSSHVRLNHDSRWLKKRSRCLIRSMKSKTTDDSRWFLKEPNLHIVTPAVFEIRENIRMVMVVRHGVDMAFSRNQQQTHLWGPLILEEPDLTPGPESSLRYWCHTHRRILKISDAYPGRVLILSFDQLCHDPEPVLRALFHFAGIESTATLIRECSIGVKPPVSIGRRHNEDISVFSSNDLNFVDEFMQSIECSSEKMAS